MNYNISQNKKQYSKKPIFDQPLHLCRPYIPDRKDLLEKINAIFDRKWLTNKGPVVEELERRIAELHEVKYCTLVCNATLGLQLVIKGLDLTGEIILPSFTFVASAHAPFWQGVQPIFCDIESTYCTIDAEKAIDLITPKTSAIMGVHIFGNPCQVERLQSICDEKGLKLIYDAAHSFASRYRGIPIGNFGDAEVLSFHATKFFSTMEGGAILTNSEELHNKLNLLKNFGFSGYDNVDYLGINAKMNEVCAAFGVIGLEKIEERIDRNRQIQQRYRKRLENVAGIEFLPYRTDLDHNYQYMVIFVDAAAFGTSRDELYRFLWDHNVLARRYFYPGCHRMEPYKSLQPWNRKLLAITEERLSKVLCLPCYFGLINEDIDKICYLIADLHRNVKDADK